MNEETELSSLIREAISEGLSLDSYEERLFIEKISLRASTAAHSYMADLEESIGHLKETIRRLSKEQGS